MPNRIIKESVCTSENIDSLTPFQETFFYRLIVNCDDYGRMDARPKLLASRLYPLKEIKTSMISDALDALVRAGLIFLYDVDGKTYLQMDTWEKHQRIRNSVGKYPAPGDSTLRQVAASCGELPQVEEDRGEMRPESNPIQYESESNPKENPRERARAQLELFNRFWEAYPRKTAKQDAVKAFGKLKADEALLETMLAALEKQKAQWDDPKYIPHPATWLNGHRWEDEPVKMLPKQTAQNDYNQRDYGDEERFGWLKDMLTDEEVVT